MEMNPRPQQSVPARVHWSVQVQVQTVLPEAQPRVLFSSVEIHGGGRPQAS